MFGDSAVVGLFVDV